MGNTTEKVLTFVTKLAIYGPEIFNNTKMEIAEDEEDHAWRGGPEGMKIQGHLEL